MWRLLPSVRQIYISICCEYYYIWTTHVYIYIKKNLPTYYTSLRSVFITVLNHNAHLRYVTHSIKAVQGLFLIVHVAITGQVHSRVFRTSESGAAFTLAPQIGILKKKKKTRETIPL